MFKTNNKTISPEVHHLSLVNHHQMSQNPGSVSRSWGVCRVYPALTLSVVRRAWWSCVWLRALCTLDKRKTLLRQMYMMC